VRLRAFELIDGGAVLVDTDTGFPLPIPPGYFHDQADAEAFLVWAGEPCGDVRHLRAQARTWCGEARTWKPCPFCKKPGARCMPGQAACPECGCDAEFARTA
jgi:hypothetical protein